MIDFDAPTPLYVQIADHLQRRIADGDITRRLPGVRVIADTYGVAHATAARAVKDLVARGVAVSVPGRGLPTAREFADEFGISARTVTDALAVLRESGEVIGVRGRGVSVRPDANWRPARCTATDLEELTKVGCRGRRSGTAGTTRRSLPSR